MDDSIFYNISNENVRMEGEIAALKRRIEELEEENKKLLQENANLSATCEELYMENDALRIEKNREYYDQ